MQLGGGTQRFHSVIVLGQHPVAEKAVHTAVTGLAQVYHLTMAATFFAGYKVVAARVLHGARAETAMGGGRALGTGRSFGGGLNKLLAAGHGTSGRQIELISPIFYPVDTEKLRGVLISAYIDCNLIPKQFNVFTLPIFFLTLLFLL